MATGILSQTASDKLNRAGEIKREMDFCGEHGALNQEIRRFMGWLGDYLRCELQREGWEEPDVEMGEDGVTLCLYSPAWQLPDGDYVAFGFRWPNSFREPPSVMVYVPAENAFPARDEMLARIRPKLRLSGFTDYHERGDPDPFCPIWKSIPLEPFHRESGFDVDSFLAVIVDGFRRLMRVEKLVEDAFRSLPEKPIPHPSERGLKTIAILDTEFEGSGNAIKMTQLAIVNVAYDAEGDAVAGVLEEYYMGAGQTLDEARVRGALERASCIVAHNAFGADRPLLARHLPGTEKMKWLCSFQGIEWKQLLGTQSASLEALVGKAGLRYEQDHNARADARDLRRLLSLKHNGRTYLGRLLDSPQAEGSAPVSVRAVAS